jgi:hypothetical protein
MGVLRVLSREGDRTVQWDEKQVAAGDLDAVAAVREAERIFEEQLRKGATAFRVSPEEKATRLVRFDPEADQIVVVPRVQGG